MLVRCFNPRTHTGCDKPAKAVSTKLSFQSTHPHGVRPIRNARICNQRRGFNPRTHTGCDPFAGFRFAGELGFNPRTHTGCDSVKPRSWPGVSVSIHAPTRGATLGKRLCGKTFLVSCFNPRTHTGCDTAPTTICCKRAAFQSTHPHGVRRTLSHQPKQGIKCFNPRTHTGCDSVQSYIL